MIRTKYLITQVLHLRNTNRSKLGLSTISLVFGNATAGGCYVPGMPITPSFEKQSKGFFSWTYLVKMATTEVSTEEELGGAEMHSNISVFLII